MKLTLADIYSFLHEHKLAVLSTVSATGNPEAALIGFGETKAAEIIFGTSNKARKYNNLKSHSRVALVIGLDSNTTLQYEGTSQELDREHWEEYLLSYHQKVPSAEKYRNLPDQTYFLVQPTLVRLVTLTDRGEEIAEYSL